MSHPIELCPDLQKLLDDFVSVRQRFTDLAETYVKQKLQLQLRQSEIDNVKKELSSMKQIITDKDRLAKSYDQLKRDYDLLYSSSAKQKQEIHNTCNKHLRDLEDQLKAERVKCIEQADSHKRIILDYEAKLREAEEKIRRRQLIRPRDETSYDFENVEESPASKTVKRGATKKWPELPLIRIKSKPGPAGRGRSGRGRGAATKRKLFVSRTETPIDII